MVIKRMKLVAAVLGMAGCLVLLAACNKDLMPQMVYNRARNLHDHGHIDKAIMVYKKVLEISGNNSEVYYDLGVAYADKGDMVNAKKQVDILRSFDRADLADVLETVIRDANSARVRKRLQGEYDARQDENK